jgi:hypothetical protein
MHDENIQHLFTFGIQGLTSTNDMFMNLATNFRTKTNDANFSWAWGTMLGYL